MRRLLVLILLWAGMAIYSPIARAQQPESLSEAGVCTFSDDKQMTMRYTPVTYDKKNLPPQGKAWAPGGTPWALFTEAPLVINNKDVGTGAYNVYLIPEKNTWTMVVSKNVTAGAPYDESQDLVRAPMETEKLPELQKTLSLYFGHIAPKKCSLRMDFGMLRTTVEFAEK